MKIEKSKPIMVEIYGKQVELKSPTYGQIKDLARSIKEDQEKANEFTAKFLEDLGLHQDVLNEMEVEHVVSLCEFLTSKKK